MIQIGGQRAEPVGDRPLEHLVACHRRIEEKLQVLQRVGSSFETDRTQALEALAGSLRFFRISGELHTRDEEDSLFPRLRPFLNEEELAYVDALESQHEEVESIWSEFSAVCSRLTQHPAAADVERYGTLIADVAAKYRLHIASEDELLIAISRRVLDSQALAEIGEEMRIRRRGA